MRTDHDNDDHHHKYDNHNHQGRLCGSFKLSWLRGVRGRLGMEQVQCESSLCSPLLWPCTRACLWHTGPGVFSFWMCLLPSFLLLADTCLASNSSLIIFCQQTLNKMRLAIRIHACSFVGLRLKWLHARRRLIPLDTTSKKPLLKLSYGH